MATFESGERVNELIFGPDLNDFLHQESSRTDRVIRGTFCGLKLCKNGANVTVSYF